MLVYNLTDETVTSSYHEVVEIPAYIRKAIHRNIETQQNSPKRKAEDIVYLLQSMGIMGSKDTGFYVGLGKSHVPGYTVFRSEMRKLGYTAMARVRAK